MGSPHLPTSPWRPLYRSKNFELSGSCFHRAYRRAGGFQHSSVNEGSGLQLHLVKSRRMLGLRLEGLGFRAG